MSELHEYHVKRTALIDADYLAYQTACAAHSHQMDLQEMTERLLETLGLWVDMACASDAILFFSCSRGDNFRRAVYPPYKAHRESTPPDMLADCHRILRDTEFRWYKMDNLEADDLIGIAMTNGRVDNPVCVTRDKDLRQVPGWHLNPFAEDFPSYVTQEQGDYLFHLQWLHGDAVDGFPGIKGVGPKRAEKILHDLEGDSKAMTVRTLEEYEKAGFTEEEALAQARCARILQAADWDRDKQEPILWTPTGSKVTA